MGVLDANPPLPEFRSDYVLQEVDAAWLSQAVKPKQFIHIDQSESVDPASAGILVGKVLVDSIRGIAGRIIDECLDAPRVIKRVMSYS